MNQLLYKQKLWAMIGPGLTRFILIWPNANENFAAVVLHLKNIPQNFIVQRKPNSSSVECSNTAKVTANQTAIKAKWEGWWRSLQNQIARAALPSNILNPYLSNQTKNDNRGKIFQARAATILLVNSAPMRSSIINLMLEILELIIFVK